MPEYCFRCPQCNKRVSVLRPMKDWDKPKSCPHCSSYMGRDLAAEHTNSRSTYKKPIEMFSVAVDPEDISAFRQRNPGVDVAEKGPLTGVPIARSRTEKLSILKNEGFHENN